MESWGNSIEKAGGGGGLAKGGARGGTWRGGAGTGMTPAVRRTELNVAMVKPNPGRALFSI